jgi:hypothetical protein
MEALKQKADMGRTFIRFLRMHEPGYPLPEQAAFRDFKDFLQAYHRYLFMSGERPRLKDPAWGLDPSEGLVSSTQAVEHCVSELEVQVLEYERQAAALAPK